VKKHLVVAILLWTSAASAAPTERKTLDLRGDVVAIGNTMGWDCGRSSGEPAGSTVTCTGVLESDNAPDLYWRDNTATATLDARSARTSANLTLPTGATVTYARLYWSGLKDNVTTPLLPDPQVTLDFEGGASLVVNADASSSLTATGPGSPVVPYIAYQSTADVTTFVQANGARAYRVTGIDGIALNGVATENAYSAWTLVVAYSLPDAPYRRVSLFDGLDVVNATSASFTATGFRVPSTARGKLIVWAYDGDHGVTTDSLMFKTTTLSNAINPATDFFNSSRSELSVAVAGAVPAISGVAGTMAGYDLDTVDVGALLAAGDTTATVTVAGSATEEFWFGGGVTSIGSAEPNIVATKTFVDLNGGTVEAGDVLEFTITAKNEGDDEAIGVTITDALPGGLTYVAGSLKSGTATLTDASADDTGEVVGTTVTVRVGTGATSTAGGSLAVGDSATISFRVTVSGSGTLVNQASVRASGKLGAPAMDYLTDGDPLTPGRQGTNIVVGGGDGGVTDAGATDGGDASADAATDATTDALDASGDSSFDAAGDGASDAVSDTATDTSISDSTVTDATDSTIVDSPADSDDSAATADSADDTGASSDAIGVTDGGGDATDAAFDNLDGFVAEGGGCGCRTLGSSGRTNGVLAALGLGMFLLRRRPKR
jgi:uncharacterized repeat protein (TIGR01451 family)/MYXO-CTERM domain-containing protein